MLAPLWIFPALAVGTFAVVAFLAALVQISKDAGPSGRRGKPASTYRNAR